MKALRYAPSSLAMVAQGPFVHVPGIPPSRGGGGRDKRSPVPIRGAITYAHARERQRGVAKARQVK
jgi:hypothetical protein